MTQAWSVTGAIAMQTAAHNELVKAVENKTGYTIWYGNCQITSCASLAAARLWVGKSKKYTIKQM